MNQNNSQQSPLYNMEWEQLSYLYQNSEPGSRLKQEVATAMSVKQAIVQLEALNQKQTTYENYNN